MNLEIGVCSYRNPEKLKRALDSIHANTVQPFKLRIWHNVSADKENDAALKILDGVKCERTVHENVGYAGAVNGMLARCRAPYFLYCDNDIEVQTRGWDERLMEVLVSHPEVAQVFPGSGHYGFFNGRYHECLWNAGYCWMFRMSELTKFWIEEIASGPMDERLGHHEEVDLMIRLRLAGLLIACVPAVKVIHHETATQSDNALHKPGGRIHDGVVRWMNKWNKYFCDGALRYSMTEYDPRALRYTDWPPCALYLERMTLHYFPDWNANPRTVQVPGVGEMDVIEILKPKGCYRGRAI